MKQLGVVQKKLAEIDRDREQLLTQERELRAELKVIAEENPSDATLMEPEDLMVENASRPATADAEDSPT